jgi:hypothetical protein
MNGGLNSRQTVTSFHPSRLLSLAFLFDFFLVLSHVTRAAIFCWFAGFVL